MRSRRGGETTGQVEAETFAPRVVVLHGSLCDRPPPPAAASKLCFSQMHDDLGASDDMAYGQLGLRFRLPTLWSRSYYAGSVGAVSEAAVRRYIEAQKGA